MSTAFLWLYSHLHFFILLSSIGHAFAADPAVLPAPEGKYGVSLSSMELVDKDRTDPFNSSHPRRIMISAFNPSVIASRCRLEKKPYMPPATANLQDEAFSQFGIPLPAFSRLELSLCSPPSRRTSPPVPTSPLVLLSPGLGNSRLLYSHLAQTVASAGYLVVTIDHPYDADIVEFPNGDIILAANITDETQIGSALDTRVKDVSFVLESLSNRSTLSKLFVTPPKCIDTNRAAIFGHSLGGATAVSAMLSDGRIVASANLDGSFFGNFDAYPEPKSKPMLLFGHEGKNKSTDASWKDVWSRMNGWKLQLELEGAQHGAFADLPALVQALGLGNLPGDSELGAAIGALIGTIDGLKVSGILGKILVGFFKYAQQQKPISRLEEALNSYKEVRVVDSGV